MKKFLQATHLKIKEFFTKKASDKIIKLATGHLVFADVTDEKTIKGHEKAQALMRAANKQNKKIDAKRMKELAGIK